MRAANFNIPYDFVQQLEESGQYAEFAVWLKLKALFQKHTIIYDWTYPKVSKLSGISIPTLRKYIPKLIENDWASVRDKHLLLHSWKDVCGSRTKNSGIIHVTKSMSFNEVKDRLRALPIERDYKTQKFIIELRSGRLKSSSKKIKEWYKEYHSQMIQPVEKNSNLILTSTRRIAQQTNLSQPGAWQLLKRLAKYKVLSSKAILEVVNPSCNYVPQVEVANGYLYRKDRVLYLNKGTSICPLHQ